MIKICITDFDPWQALLAHQNAAPNLAKQYGATSVFVGTMRDFNQGDSITSMNLEHYPGMTEESAGGYSRSSGKTVGNS